MWTIRINKKAVAMVLAVVAIVAGMFIGFKQDMLTTVHAEEARTTGFSKAERNVLKVIFEIEESLEDEDEEIKDACSVETDYTDLGYGIYDITLIFHVKKDTYEAHIIYDGEEDEEVVTYGIMDGQRIDIDEWGEIVEAHYPELAF